MSRSIIHVDMDAFYASVEQRDNPELKNKPIAVGKPPKKRGVVCAASYEARKFGIKSGMPTALAIKKCPRLIIIEPDFAKYEAVSKELFSIYKIFTNLIEPLSLDECFLDVTKNKLNMTPLEIGKAIKGTIKMELNLTASVGIAPNKLLAKIASDINKPDGLFYLKEEEIENFMKDLEVSKLWGVGEVTFNKLKSLNITTCNELQKLTILELSNLFGVFGETLFYFARGIDNRAVEPERIEKSIGEEKTFITDTDDKQFLAETVKEYARNIVDRLKNGGYKAKTVTLKIKYNDFSVITRSKTLKNATDDFEEIFETANELFIKNYDNKKKVRLIGVSIKKFDNNTDQLLLFQEQ